MFCKYCGNEIDESVVVCPHCGKQIGELKTETQSSGAGSDLNVLALVGFILSFFISIAGLICSIIAYKQIKENGGNGRGLAIAGIALGATFTALIAIYIVAVIGIVGCTVCAPIYYY